MLALCALCFASITFAQATRPNVVLILVDDAGYGDFSIHGNPVIKTPNVDRLHGESIRFTDFHVTPMCTPTRGQLMSGVDALRNGAMNVSSGRAILRREYPTMAEVFANNGYRTGIFGKWHLGDNYPYRPQDRGFQESIWYPSSHIPSAAGYFDDDYFDDHYYHNGPRQPYEGYTTDVFFREAKAWMRQQAQRKQPFFCYLPLAAAHGPLFVPDRYREPYRGQRPAIASFFGMIANIDEHVGALDDFLRENGLRENTVLIFMTDNGTATGDPVFNAGMRGKKISLYDGGHRVPFFLRWPAGGLRAPVDLDLLAEAQDVLPTLVELLGLNVPVTTSYDGISLAAWLRGTTRAESDRAVVVQFSRMNEPVPKRGDAAVLWKKWRLVNNEELYDVARDPGQQRNVLAEFPAVAARLREHYAQWWAGVEPRVNEFSAIHLGSPKANPTMLTPCDWCDVFFDQQAQVRKGIRKNGAWSVFVEQEGDYEIALRRWPAETEAAITAGLPPYKGVDGSYVAGEALPITSAEVEISEVRQTKRVAAEDKAVSFTARLPKGAARLQTWFRDASGAEIAGAYYVYVRRIDGAR